MQNHKIENFLLIIGSMKCGTTSLFNHLAEHPEISGCKEKEPKFFTQEGSWKRGYDFYTGLWDYDSETCKYALEASTNYTKISRITNAADRIHQVQSEQNVRFKFIYIIRNPVDRIISHCTHDLEAKWSVKYKQPLVHGIPYTAVETSKYAMQLEAYYNKFPREDILILSFDELKKNPKGLLKRVCEFAEIDPDFEFPEASRQHNPSKGKMATNALWPKFDRYIASPIISYLPSEKRLDAMAFVRKFFEVDKITKKVELTDVQYNFIMDELRDDLHKLKTEYGVDISGWNLGV